MSKQYLDKSVYESSNERLDFIFTEFDKIYVSFSGGKDSGVLVQLAIEAARRHNKLPLQLLIIDLEAQYRATIDFVKRIADRSEVEVHWVCLPLHLRNAVSQFQPHWLCWDENKRDAWVRDYPEHEGVVKDIEYFPFFRKGMEFEEFITDYAQWYSSGEKTACLVGIRSDESLNRFRTIKSLEKETYKNKQWSTKILEDKEIYNFYPIYDWRTEDIWVANGKFNYDYNRIYDLMYLAGLSLSQMRLCQPYGDDQRKGLYLFKILEPETWGRIVSRVEGANFGNRYSENNKTALGNFKVILPDNHTYESYARFLLQTMPVYLKVHYIEKINVFLKWWDKYCGGRELHQKVKSDEDRFDDLGLFYSEYLPVTPEKESVFIEDKMWKGPLWKRICTVLLKNDYWCKGLGFSQTKKEMEKQLDLINKYID